MKEFEHLCKMFPDGFLIIHARPDGLMRYAKSNPRRIELIELWEKYINESAAQAGPEYWKGFTSSQDIPDYMPPEWGNGPEM